jgi:hypothetical protein
MRRLAQTVVVFAAVTAGAVPPASASQVGSAGAALPRAVFKGTVRGPTGGRSALARAPARET